MNAHATNFSSMKRWLHKNAKVATTGTEAIQVHSNTVPFDFALSDLSKIHNVSSQDKYVNPQVHLQLIHLRSFFKAREATHMAKLQIKQAHDF